MSQLLYGHNDDKRIVAVSQKDDRTMRVYFRDDSGVRSEDQAFFPFFYLSESKYIEGFGKKHWLKQLEGNGYYSYLCAFEEWPAMWDAVRFVIERYNSGIGACNRRIVRRRRSRHAMALAARKRRAGTGRCRAARRDLRGKGTEEYWNSRRFLCESGSRV